LIDQDIDLSVELEIVVGLLVDEATSWSIHPNPASDYFRLKLPEQIRGYLTGSSIKRLRISGRNSSQQWTNYSGI